MAKLITRRTFLGAAAGLGGAALARPPLSAPAIAKALQGTGQVAVYDGGGSWGEAKRIAYFEPFEKETGIKIIAEPALVRREPGQEILARMSHLAAYFVDG